MDQPSWNDTLRASLSSCLPCLSTSSSTSHSDDEQDGCGTRTMRPLGPSSASADTTALLDHAALEPSPHALTRDITEVNIERRARRKARKEMRRMARLVAESPASPATPASPTTPVWAATPIPPPVPISPSPSPLAPGPHVPHPPPEDKDDTADLDGGVYARLAPRPTGGSQSNSRSSGKSSGSRGTPYSPTMAGGGYARGVQGATAGVGVGPAKVQKSKRSRTSKSKSSATSSTLASPPPSAASFAASF
ncbi:hypothetical protein B0H16DRAFT_1720162 [Mycena metata]|uniref:Uncharacterized protein n=1 Tax=Mycena metata TaxID=1033252 RepID=A0AAD7JD58_9AGAR|nr:hypothetical protein B0H16DRAFT_1720162 [Mycena metata]